MSLIGTAENLNYFNSRGEEVEVIKRYDAEVEAFRIYHKVRCREMVAPWIQNPAIPNFYFCPAVL